MYIMCIRFFSAGEREMKALSKMERNEPDREYKIPEPHRLITENKKMRTAVWKKCRWYQRKRRLERKDKNHSGGFLVR